MKRLARYSVYNPGTDMPVIIGGTARECAAAMGVTYASFRTIYSTLKNGQPRSNRWEIYRDEEDLDEDV